jgi:ADP-ribosylglycohydrolase/protein-tyrosine phosphatase
MKTLTSKSAPIRVDYLPQHVLGLRGRIGMTFAPGKKDRGVYAVWDRDLVADLERLRGVYRTNVLVSLVEDPELRLLSIPDLVEQVSATRIELRRFPFRDAGVPASLEEGAAIVRSVLEVAREGGNVVIHCRGGLGRTGLVAACALVALGQSAGDAIACVRGARERTVETKGQGEFIGRFAEAYRGSFKAEAAHEGARKPSWSRVRGCLLGGATGDALGYPIEFEKSASAILDARGRTAPRDLRVGHDVALVSDDTQMTLFVAEGVIRGIQRMDDRGICSMEGAVHRALLRWYATQTRCSLHDSPAEAGGVGWLLGERRLHARRAPGNTCMSSLAAQFREGQQPTVKTPPNDSKGCGAVMRSAPIGLAAGFRELAFRIGRDAAVLTHGHPSGYLSAAYFASIIFDVSRGVDLPHAMDLADAALAEEPGHEEMTRIVHRAREAAEAGAPSPQVIEALGGGWTGEEALAIALLCARTADVRTPDGIADALWRSVAHGGDSDSTGSITGNLLGAMYGVEMLPARWVEQVEMRDVIERVGDDLYASAVLETGLDYESYPPA